MMLLNRFTKAITNYLNNATCLTPLSINSLVILCLIVLSGCSTVSKESAREGSEATGTGVKGIDALDSSMVDMVNTGSPSSSENTLSQGASIETLDNSAVSPSYNLYTEQAQQRLANVPSSVIRQYQDALELMKQQQFTQADALFDQVLLAQPALSGALVNKALIAIHNNELELAETQLNQAIAVNDKNPYAFQLKALIARQQGQFEQAEKDYLTALSIWPNYPEAQVNLAILLELYRGKLLESRQYYQSYLQLKPDDVQAQRWLAGVEIKIQRAGISLPEGES